MLEPSLTPDEQPTPDRVRISALGLHTFVAKAGTYALGALASILIARALGPVGRGTYYLPITTMAVALSIANMGIQGAQFRLWTQKRASHDAFVTSAGIFAVTFGVVGAGLTWIIYLTMRDAVFAGVLPRHMVLVVPLLPIMLHSFFATGLLTVGGRLGRANFALMVGGAIHTLGVVILFAVDGLSVISVLVLNAIAIVSQWVLVALDLRSIGRIGFPIPKRFLSSTLALGVQLEPSLIFNYLNLRIDVFFVSRYVGLDGVGVYSIAVVFSELIWLVTDSVTQAIVERQANAPDEEMIDVTARGIRMNLLLGGAVAVASAAFGAIAIPVVYGDDFSPATAVVWALVPAATAMAVWRPAGYALLRFAAPITHTSIALIGLAVNIAGNVILIPPLGLVGAALASSVSYAVGAAAAMVVLLRRTPLRVAELLPGPAEARQLAELVTHPTRLREIVGLSRR